MVSSVMEENSDSTRVERVPGGLDRPEHKSVDVSGLLKSVSQESTSGTLTDMIVNGPSPTASADVWNVTSWVASTLRSILLTFFTLFPLSFMGLILHEGGHALADLAEGASVTSITHLYVHPFDFAGYVRPIQFWYNPMGHASGHVVSILASLLIFVLVWRRRSVSNLPLAMLFPYIAITAGIGAVENIQLRTGDFYNILYLTGLPPTVFYVLGITLAVAGVSLFVSLFPLLGLAPEDRRPLLVVPAALFMWKVLSAIVANRFVPGSSIDVQYNLAGEILMGVNSSPLFEVIIGVVLALTYVVLYRRVYRRLPLSLQTEKVNIAWGDLRNPALLFTFSVILGLIIIR